MRSPLHLHQLSIQPVRSQSLTFKSNWQHQPQPKQYVTFLTHQQPIQQYEVFSFFSRFSIFLWI